MSVNSDGKKTGSEKKRKISIVAAVVALVFIAATVGVFFYAKASKAKGGKGFGGFPGAGGAQDSVVTVRTVPAELGTLHDYVNTNGEIQPRSSIAVFPDISGKIVDVLVSLGSTVRRGQSIVEIDPSSPGAQYRHSMVVAPISGTITSAPLKAGTTVSISTAITVIGDVTNLQVTASVPERYVAALKTGLKADIVLEAYPSETFTATVTRVSPLVDATSRTKEIILEFDKRDSRINAGMFAKVKLWTLDYSGAVTIPSNAIVEKSGRQCVYVINDGKAELRPIETGNSVDDYIQLVSGVEVGDKIVVEGMRVLSEGASVKDLSDPEPAAGPDGASSSADGADASADGGDASSKSAGAPGKSAGAPEKSAGASAKAN